MKLAIRASAYALTDTEFGVGINIYNRENLDSSAEFDFTLNHGTSDWTVSVGRKDNLIDPKKTSDFKKKVVVDDSALTSADLLDFVLRHFIELKIGDVWETRRFKRSPKSSCEKEATLFNEIVVPTELEGNLTFLGNADETRRLHRSFN